jgi:hypothetical protein
MTSSLAPETILERERQSRRQGSGIEIAALAGRWRLVELWSREGSPQPRQATWLGWLGATLQLTPNGDGSCNALAVGNAVQLGALRLQFHGQGRLTGRRPLLHFSFQRLELHLGSKRLWQRPLPAPVPGREPFFALIERGSDSDGAWLLARGRGGGLARWRCP